MKLCIADPPYLGVADYWYGGTGDDLTTNRGGRFKGPPPKKADNHPDAHLWDDPETHRALVERLCADYDGWAIAMKVSSLWHYLRWVEPDRVHVAAWVKTTSMPTNSRPIRTWEPVLIRVPGGRRRAADNPLKVRDAITTVGPHWGKRFAGGKPAPWTRWVLDMLGYDPETDTVDDLFHGSGAVAAEIAQGVLPLGGEAS